MPLIKRYPNRKLYDTHARQYVTLDDIAGFIRQGEEVRVMDHATGEDLTALTLTQIIFEQEKKKGDFLPQTVLADLIRAGGDTLSAVQRSLAASLGLLHQMEDELDNRIQALVQRGELTEEQGMHLLDRLLAVGRWPTQVWPVNQAALQTALKAALARRDLPTHEELQQLNQQVDDLLAQLENISQPEQVSETP